MKKYLWTSMAVALLLPGILAAQPRRDYPPRGGRGPDISRVVADCEERTNQFRVSLRAALDRSALNGTRREDQLNVDAERLERGTGNTTRPRRATSSTTPSRRAGASTGPWPRGG